MPESSIRRIKTPSASYRCAPIKQPGRSVVELVVVAAILVALLAVFLLRLSSNRESARRMACEENLRGVFLGAESYTLRFGHFPIGTQNPVAPIRSEPSGYHHNWIEGLLPLIDQQSLYNEIDFDLGVYAATNERVGQVSVPTLQCPASITTLPVNATTYAGVVASTETPIDDSCDGMFILNRPLAPEDATDGQSYVFLAGEKSVDWAAPNQWNSGTRASLRNAGHGINATSVQKVDPLFVGGFSSNHPGGAYFLLVDGSFRFYSNDTDTELLRQLAGRSDAASGEQELPNVVDEAIETSAAEIEQEN